MADIRLEPYPTSPTLLKHHVILMVNTRDMRDVCEDELLDILNEMIGLFQILDFKLASIVFDCKCSGNDPGWTYYQANLYQMMAEVVKSEQVLYYSKEQLQQLTVSTTKVSYYISVTQSHTYLQSVQGLYYG